ncbi:MAG: PLP-dependent aminotransferase family protein [Chloroflexota bacterium]
MNALRSEELVPRLTSREVYGSDIDETIATVARQTRDTISFAVGSPAREAIERVGAADLARTAIERAGTAALGYGITEGEPELRALIAAEATARGVPADPEQVIVTAGALQAVDLVCRVLIRPGDVAVVEAPGFTNAVSALRNHGARIVEVPVDDEGIDVTAAARMLRELGARPALFFVVPTFQNPSGVSTSFARRRQLLALAASYGSVVVSDDPYARLRYCGAELPDLAALGGDATVISIGSFSKVFLPGLRVGWAIADPETVRAMARAKQTVDSSTSSLGQHMVMEFARRGSFPEHVAWLRDLYRAKQEAAGRALAAHFGTEPGVSWNEPEGGFYRWVRFPEKVRARGLLDLALEEGVAFVPGDVFSASGQFASCLRFSYSSPTPDRIDEGVRRLRSAYQRLRSS